MTSVTIHPTAIVSKSAVIGEGTKIGAYTIIGDRVVIGARNIIVSHVVIEGKTNIGDDNKIYQFASIGSDPQDLKYAGEETLLSIGNGNLIREYVTLQPGTKGGGGITKIGDKNLFMVSSHIGHDCEIGSRNIFANSVAIAGHVTVANNVTVGGLSGVHQFVRLGSYAFLGAGSMVSQDIPPCCIAQGDRARVVGINKIGLERSGFPENEIVLLKSLYRNLFISKKGTYQERLSHLKEEYLKEDAVSEKNSMIKEFLNFVIQSERGIAIPEAAKK
jgi:UDP-N-acetylglucosamine acyltransferase